MKVHLVDGTYELFRAYFGAPKKRGLSGREVGASAGILRSLLFLLRDESVTHVAAAFDARGLGAIVNNSRGIIFAHERPEYASRFGAARWQEAVEAATREMIAELVVRK